MSEQALGMLFVWVLVGLVCGVLAMQIAVSRDRSAGWFVVGFAFGPLGVLAALLAPRGFKTPDGRQAVTCPRCSTQQNVLATDATYECWQCKLVSPVSGAEGQT